MFHGLTGRKGNHIHVFSPIFENELYQMSVRVRRYISRADVKYCYVTGDFCHIPKGFKMSKHHQFIDSNFIQIHKTSRRISL